VVTVAPEKLEEFVEMVSASEVDFTNLGETGGNIVMIDEEEYGQIADFKALYDHAIHELMTHE
jgi:phosphoribosylformylglycinamidine synthase